MPRDDPQSDQKAQTSHPAVWRPKGTHEPRMATERKAGWFGSLLSQMAGISLQAWEGREGVSQAARVV